MPRSAISTAVSNKNGHCPFYRRHPVPKHFVISRRRSYFLFLMIIILFLSRKSKDRSPKFVLNLVILFSFEMQPSCSSSYKHDHTGYQILFHSSVFHLPTPPYFHSGFLFSRKADIPSRPSLFSPKSAPKALAFQVSTFIQLISYHGRFSNLL